MHVARPCSHTDMRERKERWKEPARRAKFCIALTVLFFLSPKLRAVRPIY